MSPLQFSSVFPSVLPIITSPVLFPLHSPHLFLIPLLVSVCLVFVLPALLVNSFCDVLCVVPPPYFGFCFFSVELYFAFCPLTMLLCLAPLVFL